MNAPLVWIGLPLLVSVFLAGFYRRTRLVAWVGCLFTGFMALLAWRMAIGEPVTIGPVEFELAAPLNILGRSITLENSDRPLITFFFLAAFIWFTAARLADVHRMFIPLGLGILALLIAAIAVEPFLFAALLIEIAVLLSIPLLNPPGTQPGQGVLRFLIFQTLGVPFILLAGWMLTGVEAGSSSLATTVRAGVILGLGFAFLLAVFPFYTWIPLLVRQSNPYAAGFILFILPTASLLFGLTFFDRYSWLQSVENLPTLLTILGIVMIVTGGIWALFENHLGRVFGYAVILETGFSLIAAGIGMQADYADFAMLFLPRLIGMAVWALALAVILNTYRSLELNSITGLGRKSPLVAISLLVAHFSLAGLPLMAGFPIKVDLVASLAFERPLYAAWILIGVTGLIIAGLKTAYKMFSPGGNPLPHNISRWLRFLLAAGTVAIIIVGILPQLFLPPSQGILEAFQNLSGL